MVAVAVIANRRRLPDKPAYVGTPATLTVLMVFAIFLFLIFQLNRGK